MAADGAAPKQPAASPRTSCSSRARLRAAGLPVGPGKAIDAIEAVKAVGIGDRDDFYWTLHAVFVQRREQREIFDQAFHIFWRNPQFLQRMMSLMLPQFRGEEVDESHQEISPRVADALRGNQAGQRGRGARAGAGRDRGRCRPHLLQPRTAAERWISRR